jgi:HEAT repeat protein
MGYSPLRLLLGGMVLAGLLGLRAAVAAAGEPGAGAATEKIVAPRIFHQYPKGGPEIIILGQSLAHEFLMVVPRELRRQPVSWKELAEGTAAVYGFEVRWFRENKVALFYRTEPDKEVESCLADLKSTDADKRADAAWRAGWLEDVRVLAPLVAATGDKDADVSRQAFQSIQRLSPGWRAAALIAGDAVVAPVGRLLEGKDEIASSNAVGALEFVDRDRAWPLLERAVKSASSNARMNATRVLSQIGGDRALTSIEGLLADPEPVVRINAACALARMGNPKGQALLEAALAGTDREARNWALSFLSLKASEKTLPFIRKFLQDKDSGTRRSAVYALNSVRGEEAAVLAAGALGDPDYSVRGAAIRAVENIGGEGHVALIEKALADREEYVRAMALGALARIGGEKYLGRVEEALQAKEPRARSWALMALTEIGSDHALALLDAAIRDTSREVRVDAVRQLAAVDPEKAVPRLERLLDNEDWSVRTEAVRLLLPRRNARLIQLMNQSAAAADRPLLSLEIWQITMLGGEPALAVCSQLLDSTRTQNHALAINALKELGGHKPLTLLARALRDPELGAGKAAEAIGAIGGNKARGLLLARLGEVRDRDEFDTIAEVLRKCYAGDPVVEKALEKLKPPKRPAPDPEAQ